MENTQIVHFLCTQTVTFILIITISTTGDVKRLTIFSQLLSVWVMTESELRVGVCAQPISVSLTAWIYQDLFLTRTICDIRPCRPRIGGLSTSWGITVQGSVLFFILYFMHYCALLNCQMCIFSATNIEKWYIMNFSFVKK